MTQDRAMFDFDIRFSNGGDVRGRDFRLDIDGDAIAADELGRRIVEDLRLLMVGTVEVSNVRIVSEAHKRAPPTDPSA